MFSFAQVIQVCRDTLNMTQPSPTHIRRESVLDSEKTHKTRPKDDYDDECQISSTEKLHQKVTSSKHNKANEGAFEKRSNSPQNSDDSMKRADKQSSKRDDDDSKTSTTTSEAGDDKQQLSPGSSHDESSSPKDHVTSTQTSNKICVVCGDKALSCNFGAITCESCKAFFRRNAFKVRTKDADTLRCKCVHSIPVYFTIVIAQ